MNVIKMIWARTIAMEDSGSSRNVSPGLNVEIVFYAYQRKKKSCHMHFNAILSVTETLRDMSIVGDVTISSFSCNSSRNKLERQIA